MLTGVTAHWASATWLQSGAPGVVVGGEICISSVKQEKEGPEGHWVCMCACACAHGGRKHDQNVV